MAFDSIYTEADWATREYFAPKVQDVIFNSNALTSMLRKNMKVVSGGTSIDWPALYKKGTQGGWIGRSDTYTHAFEMPFGVARLQWAILTEPVALYVQDILENQGSEQRRMDLVANANMAAAKTMADRVGYGMFSLSWRNTNPEMMDPLDHGVSDQTGSGDETTHNATYAGVNRSTAGNEGFRANIDDTTATLTVGSLNDLYLDCSEGSDSPTVWVANNKATGLYYDELTPIQRQQTDDLLGKAGFTAYFLNGAPWIVDSHCPSSDRAMPDDSYYGSAPSTEYVYALHLPTIQIHALKGAAFDWWGIKAPIDQWAVVGRYFASFNVAVMNPRFSGKMTAITG